MEYIAVRFSRIRQIPLHGGLALGNGICRTGPYGVFLCTLFVCQTIMLSYGYRKIARFAGAIRTLKRKSLNRQKNSGYRGSVF